LQLEGRKTLADALAEVREAVDFARYYAAEARQHFTASGVLLPGPTGEENRLVLEGRGVFACISPWNFPLAIFVGQVVAALAAGNTVVAKPAEQTPMIAMRAIELLHLAGIPKHALFGVVGDGLVGAALVRHPLIAGVAFTGSTEAARSINRTLANKNGPIVPLIAETGGQNVMIVDSTALIEAACDDIILSAFGSAGQRCSALRVLYVQHDIADRLIDMVGAAMQELRVGDPRILSTDVGPVIDDEAYERLRAHSAYLDRIGAKCHATTPMAADLVGPYLAPRLVEVETIDQLPHEVFGPILHVIRFASGHLDKIIDAMTASGYGLTFGIQTRLSTQAERLARAARVGNVYVNRSMIGAVVGVQPFGGMGLSGTGPKAGGPHYLPRFAQEKVISVNTAAAGGNVTLIAGSDD
jgi:RHH-type proline utilization regulon transcriptional repressor/proline dehydrogenase/delta 1-pyrroline-5-carboxylate dehydrogenase